MDPVDEQHSSYAYCGNNPIRAVDLDGRVILFINGLDPSGNGGSSKYWDGFDIKAMNILNEKIALYFDGSPLAGRDTPVGLLHDISWKRRYNFGYNIGKNTAELITNVARLDGTNSIKMITHSMGAAYGRGMVMAIFEYIINTNIKDVSIDLLVDFSPWQGERLPNSPIGKDKTFYSIAAHEDIVNGNRLGLRIGAVTAPNNSTSLGIAGSNSTHAKMGTYDASVLEETQ